MSSSSPVTEPSRREPGRRAAAPPRSVALDATRAWGTAIVFLVHVVGFAFGFALLAQPGPDYGTYAQRVAQWAPSPLGLATTSADVLRYSTWLLAQSVGVFVVITVIVLTIAAVHRGADFSQPGVTRRWILRKLATVYPMWILAHLGLGLVESVTDKGSLRLTDPQFWLSLIGVRFTPSTMWYGVPAWWYVGLLFGVYLVFPFLFRLTARVGTRRILTVVLPLLILLRFVGTVTLPTAWVEPWSHGTLLIGRFPEILLGIVFGRWVMEHHGGDVDAVTRRVARRWWVYPALVGGLVVSALVGLRLPGTALSTVLGSVFATVLFMTLSSPATNTAFLRWMSSRALALYLVHEVPVMMLITPTEEGLTPLFLAKVAVCVVATVIGAELLQRATGLVMGAAGRLGAHRVRRPAPEGA